MLYVINNSLFINYIVYTLIKMVLVTVFNNSLHGKRDTENYDWCTAE